MDRDLDLGLFPLGMVLLPGERAPLHIFEPRYRRLVADCAMDDLPFVQVHADDEGVARTGCATRLHTLVRRFADGRMNIVVQGVEPVEIVRETSGRSYASALVSPLADTPDEADPDLASAVRRLFGELARGVGRGGEIVADGEVPLSYAVASQVALDAETAFELLEERSESVRLERVREILAQGATSSPREQIAAERAHRNGEVSS